MPSPERGPWILAGVLGVLGVAVLVAVFTGMVGQSQTPPALAPPPVPVLATTPAPAVAIPPASKSPKQTTSARRRVAHARKVAAARARIVARPSRVEQTRDLARFEALTATHIASRWIQGFYPIYSVAQRSFGVNWLLLASIHKQESAFSTSPDTYHGLNFAGCCGGPMQFNVTNGPVSTWDMVSDSYRYGTRPPLYDHQTSSHPSLYDDFDSIMAAAHLLSSDGARYALDGGAWNAAYAYYGHDATGVTYADQVLARAIGWSQHGFCANCGLETAMVEAVHAAYGAPVMEAMTSATVARSKS